MSAVTRAAPALLFALVALAGDAAAHTKSASYSRWTLDDAGARVELRIATLELTRFRPGQSLGTYFADHLRLFAGGAPCEPGEVTRLANAPEGWAIYRWETRCSHTGTRAIRSDLLSELVGSHLHFARVADGDGEVMERVLVPVDPVWSIGGETGDEAAVGTSLSGYLRLGVEHILSGFDHLAFILALLLLARTLGEVATLVTGFTVAHSLTLGLAVLGLVRPEAAAVEILIGFSIALVAAENLWVIGGRDRAIPVVCVGALVVAALAAAIGIGALPAAAWLGLAGFTYCHFELLDGAARPARLRAVLAFAFGLVHGFGFAGVLMDLEIPTQRLLPALFGFNVGVEIGQLAVVALVWPLLVVLARRGAVRWQRLVVEAGSATVFALGLFWVVTRTAA
jgi:hypothetical protein